jgi:serine phosphatase RsbU (regulator of sigma subunit)
LEKSGEDRKAVPGEPEDSNVTVVFRRGPQPALAAQPDEIGHYLVLMGDGEPGRWIPLDPTPLTVGRDAARDVVLVDQDVSRLHLQIWLDGDQVMVEDQHSTNGTFIDGQQIAGRTVFGVGSVLQVGKQCLKIERRSKREVEQSEQIRQDLDRASQYVRSLLPAPLVNGPIQTDWLFLPSTKLGGDAVGYDQLDADTFVVYLIDVSGHGASAAMHSVSVLNVLRQRALSDADIREPAQVLASLNARFQMDRHDGMYFTMWYGVYHRQQRLLRYACAGHHAGYLVSADKKSVTPLKTPGLMIGAIPDVDYRVDQTTLPSGSSLYLFSDGAFEIVAKDQRQWRLRDFTPLLVEATRDDIPESQRIYEAVRAAAAPGPLDDDFTLIVVTFA